ncbi:MAG: hypothetical protein ABUL77_04655 [Bacteroidota bacterium]
MRFVPAVFLLLCAPLVAAQTAEPAAAVVASPDDGNWARAMDALVRGDLEAAAADLTKVEADGGESDGRRAEARDLLERIRLHRANRSAPAAVTTTPSASPTEKGDEAAAEDERGGRVVLLGTTTLAGLALWGWTLPTMFDIQNDRGFIGLYMVTAGASFGVPFLLTRRGPATWGMANMTWLGATRGALAGLAVETLIAATGGGKAGMAGGVFAGSVLGAAGAALLAREKQVTPGKAHFVGIGGDVGALTGLGVARLTGLDQMDKESNTRDSNFGFRMMAGFALGGGALGLVGGHLLSRGGDYTWGDAEVMRLPIAIGVTGAGMIMDWSGTDSSRAIVGALVAGGLGGAVVGRQLVRDRDYGVGQGFLMDLGTVAGALAAMGSVYLVTGSDRSETYLTSGFIGAAAVFSTLYLTLDAPAMRRMAAHLTPKDGRAVSRVSVLPYLGAGAGAARGLALAGSF